MLSSLTPSIVQVGRRACRCGRTKDRATRLILNGSQSYKVFERWLVWSNEQHSLAVLHE